MINEHAPNKGKTIAYKGWIPVVGGHLSFSAINLTNYPSSAIGANVHNNQERFIASWQIRTLSDALIPPFPKSWQAAIARKLMGEFNQYVYVCLTSAKSSTKDFEDNMLRGQIFSFVYPFSCSASSEAKKVFSQYVDALTDWQKLSNTLETRVDSKSIYDKADEAIAILDRDCLASFEFTLQRDGVLTLSPGSSNANVANLNWEKEAQHAYFFLRDIIHTHQHHHHEADTMLGVYPQAEDDSADWFVWPLRSLFRKIVEYKRRYDRDKYAIARAKGILAYARTLTEVAQKAGCSDWNIFADHIEQSLTAKDEELSEKSKSQSYRLFLVFGPALAVTALIISMSGVFGPIHGKDLGITFVIDQAWEKSFRFVLEFPLISYTTLGMGVYFSGLIFGGRLGTLGPYRMILRILQPIRRKFSLFILLLIILALTIIPILLFHYGYISDFSNWLSGLLGN